MFGVFNEESAPARACLLARPRRRGGGGAGWVKLRTHGGDGINSYVSRAACFIGDIPVVDPPQYISVTRTMSCSVCGPAATPQYCFIRRWNISRLSRVAGKGQKTAEIIQGGPVNRSTTLAVSKKPVWRGGSSRKPWQRSKPNNYRGRRSAIYFPHEDNHLQALEYLSKIVDSSSIWPRAKGNCRDN